MSPNLFLASVIPLNLELLAGVLSIGGLIVGAILSANKVQDKLNERFHKIELRHARLRGGLSLSFNTIENRLGATEEKLNELINFSRARGFDERQSPLKRENIGAKLWNDSGLDDETKIPED